jgi:hypothetical protein
MLAAAPFFPPWYFWVFVFRVVLVVVTGLVTMIIGVTRINCAQRVRERELAARLMEAMIQDRDLAPVEIERLINAYWRLGSFWGRFQGLQAKYEPLDAPIPPKKLLPK